MSEVQIKHAQFVYYTEGTATNPKTGEQIPRLVPMIAKRDEIVDIPRSEDIERGELHGAFYTDEDYASEDDAVEDDGDGDEGGAPEGNDHEELVTWIRDSKPTAVQVVQAADGDPERAQALLDAENEASGGDPRKSVVEPLNKIING